MTISTTTLKNAARAIGYDLWSDPDGSHYLVDYDGVKLKRWDPEHSSADSFELMVALGIKVRWHEVLNQALAWLPMGEEIAVNAEDIGNEPRIATRIAILLCAAAIGAAL